MMNVATTKVSYWAATFPKQVNFDLQKVIWKLKTGSILPSNYFLLKDTKQLEITAMSFLSFETHKVYFLYVNASKKYYISLERSPEFSEKWIQ